LVTASRQVSAATVASFQFYLVGAAEIAIAPFFVTGSVAIINPLALLEIFAGFWIGRGLRNGGILGGAVAVVGLAYSFFSASMSSIVSNSIINLVLLIAVVIIWRDLR